jgi:hypothetical protein
MSMLIVIEIPPNVRNFSGRLRYGSSTVLENSLKYTGFNSLHEFITVVLTIPHKLQIL